MKKSKPLPVDRKLVVQAYRKTCGGYSVDRVIADPVLNARFIQACREIGLKNTAVDMNLNLLN